MARALTVAATFAIVGCATQLQIVGPYGSRLSQSDIQQITALITPDPSFSHLYTRVEAIRSDEVHVRYGGSYPLVVEGVSTYGRANRSFTAYKRKGRWVIGTEGGLESSFP